MPFRIKSSNVKSNIYKLQTQHGMFACETPGTCSFTFPIGVHIFYLTATSGGGAGGDGMVDNGTFYSGGGGGASPTCIKAPIMLHNGGPFSIYSVTVTVGKGGQTTNKDGTDTIIIFTLKGVTVRTIHIQCGKGAGKGKNNTGGDNGKGVANEPGEDGESAFPSEPSPKGGNGGANNFFGGGAGGLKHTEGTDTSDYIKGLDGMLGSGGGGAALGTTVIGKGGDGFTLIEW